MLEDEGHEGLWFEDSPHVTSRAAAGAVRG